ncbi:MAG: hypothetical protein V3R63_04845 [Alphaproteobacteria bacterium]
MAAQIKFPLLEFYSRHDCMSVETLAEGLGECNGRGLKNHCFNGMSLVDSVGNWYTVRGVRAVRLASPWWKWPGEILMYNSRLFKADLELSPPESISLEDFKNKILTYIDLERGMWESGIGVEEIKAEVRNAKTPREAIEVIYGQKID